MSKKKTVENYSSEFNDSSKAKVMYVRCSSLATNKQLDEKAALLQTFLLKNGISPDVILKEKSDFFVTDYKQRSKLFELVQMIEEDKVSRVYLYSVKDFSIFLWSIFQHICNIHNVRITVVAEKESLEEDKDMLRRELSKFIAYVRNQYKI